LRVFLHSVIHHKGEGLLKLGASFSSILVLKCTGFECLLRSRGGMTGSVLPLPTRRSIGITFVFDDAAGFGFAVVYGDFVLPTDIDVLLLAADGDVFLLPFYA
ncbi:hypothetical protein C0J52_17205, partial [Blattella germanica]